MSPLTNKDYEELHRNKTRDYTAAKMGPHILTQTIDQIAKNEFRKRIGLKPQSYYFSGEEVMESNVTISPQMKIYMKRLLAEPKEEEYLWQEDLVYAESIFDKKWPEIRQLLSIKNLEIIDQLKHKKMDDSEIEKLYQSYSSITLSIYWQFSIMTMTSGFAKLFSLFGRWGFNIVVLKNTEHSLLLIML